ncbi:MAG: DUF5522 domain-containing protein [Acidobacteriaceae bacterium]|jgi:hypothetical protein
MPASPPNPASPRDADAPAPKGTARELAPEDFYYEGPYLVFTAAYHLKRGSCCHSGCRHCPYRDSA